MSRTEIIRGNDMSIKKITDAERNNVRVTGLPDTPGLATREMQQRFDGLGDLSIDKINEIVDVINNSEIPTDVKDESGKFVNINDAIGIIMRRLSALENNKIVSVAELPASPVEGTMYLVQGEVTIN